MKPIVREKHYTEVRCGNFRIEDARDNWGADLYLNKHNFVSLGISYASLKDLRDAIQAYLLEKQKTNKYLDI